MIGVISLKRLDICEHTVDVMISSYSAMNKPNNYAKVGKKTEHISLSRTSARDCRKAKINSMHPEHRCVMVSAANPIIAVPQRDRYTS